MAAKKARKIGNRMVHAATRTIAVRVLSMEGGGVSLAVSPGSVFTDAAHGYISIVGHEMDRTSIRLVFGGKYTAIVTMPK